MIYNLCATNSVADSTMNCAMMFGNILSIISYVIGVVIQIWAIVKSVRLAKETNHSVARNVILTVLFGVIAFVFIAMEAYDEKSFEAYQVQKLKTENDTRKKKEQDLIKEVARLRAANIKLMEQLDNEEE